MTQHFNLTFWEGIFADFNARRDKRPETSAGKFKGHCRQNSVARADSAVALPETLRNRARAEQVDAYLKANGGTRRMARKRTQP